MAPAHAGAGAQPRGVIITHVCAAPPARGPGAAPPPPPAAGWRAACCFTSLLYFTKLTLKSSEAPQARQLLPMTSPPPAPCSRSQRAPRQATPLSDVDPPPLCCCGPEQHPARCCSPRPPRPQRRRRPPAAARRSEAPSRPPCEPPRPLPSTARGDPAPPQKPPPPPPPQPPRRPPTPRSASGRHTPRSPPSVENVRVHAVNSDIQWCFQHTSGHKLTTVERWGRKQTNDTAGRGAASNAPESSTRPPSARRSQGQ